MQLPSKQFAVQREREADVDDGEIVDCETTQDANQSVHVTSFKRLTAKNA